MKADNVASFTVRFLYFMFYDISRLNVVVNCGVSWLCFPNWVFMPATKFVEEKPYFLPVEGCCPLDDVHMLYRQYLIFV
jgi:hypothetical protein